MPLSLPPLLEAAQAPLLLWRLLDRPQRCRFVELFRHRLPRVEACAQPQVAVALLRPAVEDEELKEESVRLSPLETSSFVPAPVTEVRLA